MDLARSARRVSGCAVEDDFHAVNRPAHDGWVAGVAADRIFTAAQELLALLRIAIKGADRSAQACELSNQMPADEAGGPRDEGSPFPTGS
jgi:hypothetical protein